MAWWDSSQPTSQQRATQNVWDAYGDEIRRFPLFPPLLSRWICNKDKDRDWERNVPYVVTKTSLSSPQMARYKRSSILKHRLLCWLSTGSLLRKSTGDPCALILFNVDSILVASLDVPSRIIWCMEGSFFLHWSHFCRRVDLTGK